MVDQTQRIRFVTRISIFIHFRYSKPFKSRFSFLTTRWRQRPKFVLSFFSAWSIWYTHQVSSLYDVSAKKQKFPKKRLGTIDIIYSKLTFTELTAETSLGQSFPFSRRHWMKTSISSSLHCFGPCLTPLRVRGGEGSVPVLSGNVSRRAFFPPLFLFLAFRTWTLYFSLCLFR